MKASRVFPLSMLLSHVFSLLASFLEGPTTDATRTHNWLFSNLLKLQSVPVNRLSAKVSKLCSRNSHITHAHDDNYLIKELIYQGQSFMTVVSVTFSLVWKSDIKPESVHTTIKKSMMVYFSRRVRSLPTFRTSLVPRRSRLGQTWTVSCDVT